MEWHVRRGNQKAGPFSEAEIPAFVASGRLVASDLVWRTGDPAWQRADAIQGLFTPPEAPPPAAPTLAESLAAAPHGAPRRAPSPEPEEVPANSAPRSRQRQAAPRDTTERRAGDAREGFENEQWAGFWRRVGAQMVDGWVLLIPSALAGILIVALFDNAANDRALGLWFLAQLLVAAAYQTFMNSAPNVASLGPRATGIAVVDHDTGEPISRGRGMGRAIASYVSSMLVLPNLVQLFTQRRQSVADLVCNTTVVRYKEAVGATAVIVFVVAVPAVVGILAAIAIPQYQDYTVRARVAEARTDLATYSGALETYVRRQNSVPPSIAALSVRPQSRSVQYALEKDGTLVASGIVPA
jgi:uncharacterized RDD family membrane protein YckC